MNDTYCALVIGLCSHGLAISRSLHNRGIEVYAFEANPYAPGFRTNSAEVHLVESINNDKLVDELIKFRSTIGEAKNIILFPTNDNNVKVIAENIEKIDTLFIVSWAKSSKTIKNLLLKSNIEARCIETALFYPKSIICKDLGSLANSVAKLRSPYIVKPINPQSGFKAFKFQTSGSLLAGLAQYSRDFPVIVQEWISGTAEDLYFCALYLDNGKPLQGLVGRKLESYPPALGQTTIAVTHNDDALMEMAQRFFSGLGISGPVSVEFKRDEQGNYWVIEPTVGRSDFWLGLCIKAGFDLPVMEYEVLSGLPESQPPPSNFQNTIWFDSDRDPLAPVRYGFKWFSFSTQSYKPVFSYFNLQDIQPFLQATARTAKRIGGSLTKRNTSKEVTTQKTGTGWTVETFDGFAALPDKFKNILEQYADDYIFFDVDWFENFRTNVAEHIGTIEILCLSDRHENALAILPLLKRQEHFHGVSLAKISSLSNYYIPRFEIFINETLCDRQSAFRHLLDYLKRTDARWDVIEIFPMFREAITDICNIKTINYPYYITENFQQGITSSYASYIQSRPTKHVNTIKRKYRKLKREKMFSFDINCGDEHTGSIMDNYHEVYHSSWKIDEPFPDFINGMVNWAADKGILRLGRLIIEDTVVASQIWIVANQTAHIYKLAYDRSFQQYSPGTLLTAAMLEHVIDTDKVRRLDFLLGSDAFKKDWMDTSTSVYGVQFPNVRTPKGLWICILNTFSILKRNWLAKKSWYEPID